MTQDKPKLTPAEQRQRREDRLVTIRLRMAIGRELENRGITSPAALACATGRSPQSAPHLRPRVSCSALRTAVTAVSMQPVFLAEYHLIQSKTPIQI